MHFSTYHLIVLGAVLLASVAQMLLKQGATKGYQPLWRQYANGWVVGGYAIMGLALVANVFAMSRGVMVKEVGCIEALAYLFVPLLACLIFKEKITLCKAAAIGMIVVGVVVFFL